jgi:hypothetical protein
LTINPNANPPYRFDLGPEKGRLARHATAIQKSCAAAH